jgi:VanZ family protein
MFFFSTDAFSSSETSRFIVPFLTFFFPAISPPTIDFCHVAIRKLAHITEYFILAMLVYRSIKYNQQYLVSAKMIAVAFVLLAALADEFHQSLTISRTASIVDVGYDCLGGVWALWLFTVYEGRRVRSHSVL